jgi:hypothetical protein
VFRALTQPLPGDTTAFLNPSENFVQLGLIEDDGIPFYNYQMI